jgi:hypothetical protein
LFAVKVVFQIIGWGELANPNSIVGVHSVHPNLWTEIVEIINSAHCAALNAPYGSVRGKTRRQTTA